MGMINKTREIILEISENRTIDIIKKMFGFHIPKGNTIKNILFYFFGNANLEEIV